MKEEKSVSEMRWEQVRKAEEATAGSIAVPEDGKLPGTERDLYQRAAEYVVRNSAGDRQARNKASRLLLMLDKGTNAPETRMAFVEMAMAFPATGEPDPSLQAAFEYGKDTVQATLASGIAKDSANILFANLKKAIEMVANCLKNVVVVMLESQSCKSERAIENLLNATKFETLRNMSEILPKDWETLYRNGMIDVDGRGYISITDERCAYDIADIAGEELSELTGMNPYAMRHDAKQLEEGLNAIVRKKTEMAQEKRTEKQAISERSAYRTQAKDSVASAMRTRRSVPVPQRRQKSEKRKRQR